MTTTVCWGAGWDSSAMLIEMHRRGDRPDLITFADVGAEKPGTYDFIPLFAAWCRDVGFPEPLVCVYQPMAVTSARYRSATVEVANRLGITLTDQQLDRLSRIYGNMVANETLPGLAFGMKSCSIKWKLEAQEPPRTISADLVAAWNRGERVRKLIGFDCTEDHRTFADGGGDATVANCDGIPPYSQRYLVEYPLRTWMIDREACGRIIVGAGLPLPPKSACFMCPAMKLVEIEALKRDEPECYALALEMERLYREGRHFRGDNVWSVKAVNRQTNEKIETQVSAKSADGARKAFRAQVGDVFRPYRWTTNVSQAVPGLGRNFAWTNA